MTLRPTCMAIKRIVLEARRSVELLGGVGRADTVDKGEWDRGHCIQDSLTCQHNASMKEDKNRERTSTKRRARNGSGERKNAGCVVMIGPSKPGCLRVVVVVGREGGGP